MGVIDFTKNKISMPKTIQKKSTATKDKSNPNQSNQVTGIGLNSSPTERRALAESKLNTPTKAKSFFDPKVIYVIYY